MNRKACIAFVLMAMVVCAQGNWLNKAIHTGVKFVKSPTGQHILKTGLRIAAGDEELKALKVLRAEDEHAYNLLADMLVNNADVGPAVGPRIRQHLDEITKPDHVMGLLDILKEE